MHRCTRYYVALSRIFSGLFLKDNSWIWLEWLVKLHNHTFLPNCLFVDDDEREMKVIGLHSQSTRSTSSRVVWIRKNMIGRQRQWERNGVCAWNGKLWKGYFFKGWVLICRLGWHFKTTAWWPFLLINYIKLLGLDVKKRFKVVKKSWVIIFSWVCLYTFFLYRKGRQVVVVCVEWWSNKKLIIKRSDIIVFMDL